MRSGASPARGATLALGALLGVAAVCSCAPLATPPASAPPPPSSAPAAPAGPLVLDREPTLDVGLAWDLDSLSLGSSGSLVTEVTTGATPGAGDAWYSVESREGRVLVRPGSSLRGAVLHAGDTLVVRRRDGDRGGIGWNGKTWRGELHVFVNPRGRLTLVSRLPLETYLLGVLPGELGPLVDDRIEAGRAQAIAARSYTLFYRGRRAAEGFDLFGTVEDQVYGPIESERAVATRVVESTHGWIALSQGRAIRANYSSTCGGITTEVWEAWPAEALPYLVSHRDRGRAADWCAGSPHYRWREEWTPAELAANLARYAPEQGVPLPPGGVGEIVDVCVLSRSRSGRVWRLLVRTTRGDVVVPAWSLRQLLRRGGQPASILRSNLFKIDVRRDRATGRALAIVASGAGNGHGVGLCQVGALGMAKDGARGESIVQHYYPGVELRRFY